MKTLSSRLHAFSAFLWVVLVVVCSAFNYKSIFIDHNIQTDILALLPKDSNKQLKEIKTFMDDHRFQDRVLILVGHKDQEIAKEKFLDLRSQVKGLPLVEQKVPEIAKGYKDLFQKLYPFRHGLIHHDDAQKDLHFFTERALSFIASPVTMGTINLKEDPFFLFSSFVQKAMPSLAFELDKDQDMYIQQDDVYWYVYHAVLEDSAFSLDLQKQVINNLDPFFKECPKDVHILRTGALFYSAAGFDQANKEMSSIGILSTIGVLLLIILFFKSLWPIGMTLIVIAASLSVGFWACFFVFKSIHIIALLFGCSLIGITVDYVIHYCYAAKKTTIEQNRFDVFKSLMPALFFAACSSSFGYLILAGLPFPGLQQMAIVASVGIASAFLSVFLWAPYLIKVKSVDHHSDQIKTSHPFLGLITKLGAVRFIRYGWILFVLVSGSFSYKGIIFNDDIKSFQSMDASLKNEEEKIKSLMQIEQPRHFVVFKGKSIQDILRQEEAFLIKYPNFVQKALSQIIPSHQRQQENKKIVRQLYEQELPSFKEMLGVDVLTTQIDPSVFDIESIDCLPEGIKPLIRKEDDGTFSSRIFLTNDAENLEDVFYINPMQEYSKILKDYRETILKMGIAFFAVGMFFIYFFLRLRRRGKLLSFLEFISIPLSLWLREGSLMAIDEEKQGTDIGYAFSIFFPVILSLILSVSTIQIMGEQFSLFHVIGAFLVACLGIDYALFLFFKRKQETLTANFVCALTTIVSFGFLAFSQTKAIHDFGLFVFFGISFCFFNTTLLLGKRS